MISNTDCGSAVGILRPWKGFRVPDGLAPSLIPWLTNQNCGFQHEAAQDLPTNTGHHAMLDTRASFPLDGQVKCFSMRQYAPIFLPFARISSDPPNHTHAHCPNSASQFNTCSARSTEVQAIPSLHSLMPPPMLGPGSLGRKAWPMQSTKVATFSLRIGRCSCVA